MGFQKPLETDFGPIWGFEKLLETDFGPIWDPKSVQNRVRNRFKTLSKAKLKLMSKNDGA